MERAILVIDDEPFIRELVKEILTSRGFEVYTAESGIEGLKVFKEKREEIGLIILDLVMPGMDGYETFSRLKGIDDDIKVVIITGYAPIREDRISEGEVIAIVKKPFTAQELLSAVGKAMGK